MGSINIRLQCITSVDETRLSEACETFVIKGPVRVTHGINEDNLKIRTPVGSLVGQTRIKLIVVVHLEDVRPSYVV
jgi:hypothetical protein